MVDRHERKYRRILVVAAIVLIAAGVSFFFGVRMLAGDGEIFQAIALGEYWRVRAILTVYPESIRALGADGRTPLHEAAWEGNAAIARLLIARGADARAPSEGGAAWTPLHYAVHDGEFTEVVDLLIDNGADVNAKDAEGETPLYHAITCSHDATIVAKLITAGVDIEAGNSTGWKPLHVAVFSGQGQPAMARLLVEHGAQVDVHVASGLGDLGRVEEFLSADAEAARRSLADGTTALHMAAYNGCLTVAERLLAAGADVNATNQWGWTPLHAATVGIAGKDLIQLLVDHGADLQVKDTDGETPLDIAEGSTMPGVAELLRALGAAAADNPDGR